MNTFPTIRKLDSTILYVLELMSSISVILLSIGLILSMSNVLTAGAILTDSTTMSHIWAVGQTVALDTGLSGAVYRVVVLGRKRQYLQMSLYLVLSMMLLFTAVIVSNIESLQQTLNITLTQAYTHSPIPVETLVWMRSFCIVLLIIGHAVKHADGATDMYIATKEDIKGADTPPLPEEEIIVTEEQQVTEKTEEIGEPEVVQELPSPKQETETRQRRTEGGDMLVRVQAYMLDNPTATARQAAQDLKTSPSTANKYMRLVKRREEGV